MKQAYESGSFICYFAFFFLVCVQKWGRHLIGNFVSFVPIPCKEEMSANKTETETL
jgi:hypothetical protein